MLRLLTLAWLLLPQVAGAAGEWPQFRGPDGQGHAEQRGLPTEWSETKNIAFKSPIAGLGWSSPVIADGQIWLTTALDEGHSLHAVCLDVSSGELLHDVGVFLVSEPGSIHKKNSYASPTPILDANRVYVHFGDLGTACLATDGTIVWRTDELKYQHGHGPAGSPVLYGDLLIVSCDGTDVQYVAALDKKTGKVRWKSPRQGRMAYSTPLVINVAGEDQLVSTGGDQAVAYEPTTGREIWRVRYDGYSEVPRPAYGQGLVFLASGYDTPWLYAVRPDGRDDVTDTHVAWKLQSGAPLNPSPLIVGEDLYLVDDRGIVSCLDAKTGKKHWQKHISGNYSASPLLADGKIYFTSEQGLTTVIKPGRQYRALAANQIEGDTLASLAVSGKALFLRSGTHLYRIEEKR
ncbi:MAG TPA: PQQ-binding-like beta-propeller repeat protein [Pirellulales bacterium]|jgi:outer membrane protein assembly factor BamB|nr:PQQ-binding-like beta-propeller repeat protein [Pirellulales bacterium]